PGAQGLAFGRRAPAAEHGGEYRAVAERGLHARHGVVRAFVGPLADERGAMPVAVVDGLGLEDDARDAARERRIARRGLQLPSDAVDDARGVEARGVLPDPLAALVAVGLEGD